MRPLVNLWGIFQSIVCTLQETLVELRSLESRHWIQCWSECDRMGNQSLPFVAVVSTALGMTLVYQSGLQAQRILGDLSMLGGLYLQILLREFAPTITALMLTTKVGTGIAAEIGSMVITEQIDALRMSGTSPIRELLTVRWIASMIMVPVLSIYATLIFYLAGAWIAHFSFHMALEVYFDLSKVSAGDLWIFALKSLSYGMTIPIVSGDAGFRAPRGSQGVSLATTQALVRTSLIIVFWDLLWSVFGYLLILRP